MDNCTIGNRVLIHLSCYSKYSGEYVCPPEMTQDGMALKLGISRAHAALELKRLSKRDQVEYALKHVVKAKSRRKVYSLTTAGENAARELKDQARMKRVTLIDGNGGIERTGQEALKLLCAKGLSESDAIIKILTSEAIPINGNGHGWQGAAPPDGLVGRDHEFAKLNRWLHSPGKALCILSGADGVGKTTLSKSVSATFEDFCVWQRVKPLQSVRSLLAAIGESLMATGKPRLKAMMEESEFDESEAALVVAEDMAGGLLVLDDAHNSPEVENFASRFMAMNDWPLKVLLIARRKPLFSQKWSDTFQKPHEDIILTGLDLESSRRLLGMQSTAFTEEGLIAAHTATQGRPLDLLILSEFGWSFEATEVPDILSLLFSRLGKEEIDALSLVSLLRGPIDPTKMELNSTHAALFRRKSLFQECGKMLLLHDTVRIIVAESLGIQQKLRLCDRAARLEESWGDALGAAIHCLASGNRKKAVTVLASNADSLPLRDVCSEMLSLLRAIGEESRLEAVRGKVLDISGRLDEAKLCYERAIAGAEGKTLIELLLLLGDVEMRMGLPQDAARNYRKANEMTRESDDESLRAGAKRGLALASEQLGLLEKSVGYMREARDAYQRIGRDREAARCSVELARLEKANGNPAGSIKELTTTAQRLDGESAEAASVLTNLALALEEEGDHESALLNFLKAAKVAKECGMAGVMTRSLAGAGECCLALGKTEEALEHCRNALKIGERLGNPKLLSIVHTTLGRLNGRMGLWRRAESHLMASIELLKKTNSHQDLAARYRDLAALYEAAGDNRKAKLWVARAERMMEWDRSSEEPELFSPNGEAVGA